MHQIPKIMMTAKVIEEGNFKYVEQGHGNVLLILHGLFGALSNFSDLIDYFSKTHRVIVPMLPLYEMPLKQSSVSELAKFIDAFVTYKSLESVSLIGNSLGGHIALLYALEQPNKVQSMVLTGSSGLFENAMGDTFPRRGDYDYIRAKTESTFFDPKMASKELVDEVFEIVNNREKALRVIGMARSAIRQNMGEDLHKIEAPTLLIWGENDNITPPFVAEDFDKLLPNSELHFIPECGHAPMMERPKHFNKILNNFLQKLESNQH